MGNAALKTISLEAPDVLIVDLKMPGMSGLEVMQSAKELDNDLPVILITAYAEVRGAVEAMKSGAHDYLAKPFKHEEVMRVILRAINERRLKQELKHISNHVKQIELREMMGTSDAIKRLTVEVNRVAKSIFTVLILGETGTGKEVIAHAIHQVSSRSRDPFVPVDCGAIPETLIESDLFGYEKGAFTRTGANARKIRGGQRRNAVPGRNFEPALELASQTLTRASGKDPLPCRRHEVCCRRYAARGCEQP